MCGAVKALLPTPLNLAVTYAEKLLCGVVKALPPAPPVFEERRMLVLLLDDAALSRRQHGEGLVLKLQCKLIRVVT